MPLRIGLCIAGKAAQREWRSTAALDEHVVRSQLEHLLPGLSAQGSLDTFFVLDATDEAEAAVQDVVRRFAPVDVRYDNSSMSGLGYEEQRSLPSYMKLKACADIFEQAERRRGITYDWMVRSRPDLYFYGGMPTLVSLDAGAIHSRMRCMHFSGEFVENQISSENHHFLRADCASRPSSCRCRQRPDCPTDDAVRMDDQFALVPRALMRAYFASHADSVHHGLSNVTGDYCSPLQCTAAGCKCTAREQRCNAWPECQLTNSILVNARARVVPTALYHTIARTRSKKWGAGRRLGPLFLDAVLVNGGMDALANQTYRQIEGCNPPPASSPPPLPPSAPLPSTCVDSYSEYYCKLALRKGYCSTRDEVAKRQCRATCAKWCQPGKEYLAMVARKQAEYRIEQQKESWVTHTIPFEFDEGVNREKMLRTCGTVLFNGHWEGYRLADMLQSRYFRRSAAGLYYHQKHYPGSFVDIFLRHYGVGTARFRALPPNCTGFPPNCNEWVEPAVALADIITKQGTQRAPPLKELAVVQIRAGDVLDRSPYSVDQMLAGPTNFSWQCPRKPILVGEKKCSVVMTVQKLTYALPRAHWVDVAKLLRERGISRASIIAGSHYNLTDRYAAPRYNKSCEYIARVGDVLADAGISVRYRLGQPPDDDVRFMSRAKVVAPSGGQFARYASDAAALLGAEVLREGSSSLRSSVDERQFQM